jgi:hypothetical protein
MPEKMQAEELFGNDPKDKTGGDAHMGPFDDPNFVMSPDKSVAHGDVDLPTSPYSEQRKKTGQY